MAHIIQHVGLILDGNRRFATQKGESATKGHRYGAETLKKILAHLDKKDVKKVTLYAFSTENFNRPEEEKRVLFDLFREFFSELFSKKETDKKEICVKFAGQISLFPDDIQEMVEKLTTQTAQNSRRIVNICFGYGGREEIVHATQLLAKKVAQGELQPSDITEAVFTDALYVKTQPDLIIRTGKRYRTSNFLPWQSVYSEWFFLEKTWPEMKESDIDTIFEEFSLRTRTFGK